MDIEDISLVEFMYRVYCGYLSGVYCVNMRIWRMRYLSGGVYVSCILRIPWILRIQSLCGVYVPGGVDVSCILRISLWWS